MAKLSLWVTVCLNDIGGILALKLNTYTTVCPIMTRTTSIVRLMYLSELILDLTVLVLRAGFGFLIASVPDLCILITLQKFIQSFSFGMSTSAW